MIAGIAERQLFVPAHLDKVVQYPSFVPISHGTLPSPHMVVASSLSLVSLCLTSLLRNSVVMPEATPSPRRQTQFACTSAGSYVAPSSPAPPAVRRGQICSQASRNAPPGFAAAVP